MSALACLACQQGAIQQVCGLSGGGACVPKNNKLSCYLVMRGDGVDEPAWQDGEEGPLEAGCMWEEARDGLPWQRAHAAGPAHVAGACRRGMTPAPARPRPVAYLAHQVFDTREYTQYGRYKMRLYDGARKKWRTVTIDDWIPWWA